MLLILQHPEVASRDCSDCQRYQYNEQTGRRETRRGAPLKRIGKTPCEFVNADGSTRCPKGTPTAGIALSDKNVQAWLHYLECKATGLFPDDPIVRRNAGIIRRVEDQVAETRQREAIHELFQAMLKVR